MGSNKANVFNKRQKIAPPEVRRMKGQNKCFIFSNRFEGTPHALPQNEIDEENIAKTFKWLNFDVYECFNLSLSELQTALHEMLTEDFSDDECIVCFFISHGGAGKNLYTNDKRKVNISDLVQNFVNCRQLNGKAKLFFVSACRGNNWMETVEVEEEDKVSTADSKKKVKRAKDADVFIYFPTTEGNTAWGNKAKGSYFVDTLCRVLRDYGGSQSLSSIALKVNDLLSKSVRNNPTGDTRDIVAVGEVQHTLTYKFFFNPKTPDFPEDYK